MAQLSPVFNIPYFTDDEGKPLAGGKIFQYEAGSSSVLKTTFTGPDGVIANSNPIVLNSAGQLPGGISIWLSNGEAYNLVLTLPDGTTVLKSFDNVTGVIQPSGGGEQVENPIWVETAGATFLSATQFLVPGNVTSQYAPGNRARLTISTGFTYGTVTASAFSSPNTTVTILNDGAVLNSSLEKAEYSLLIAAGETVDAGGVSYFDAMPYSLANTVGWKIKQLVASGAASSASLLSRIERGEKVWDAVGTVGSNTAYEIVPSPAATSYAENQIFVVKFDINSTGQPTLNVNGIAAAQLKQYDYTGTHQAAVVKVDQVSQVAYDGTHWILLDQLPANPVVPSGMQVIASNGTFTVPAGVYTIKVWATGGGGGGGDSWSGFQSEEPFFYAGGPGGPGGTAMAYISTAPATVYNVTIGAGGGINFSAAGDAGGATTFGAALLVGGGGGGGAWGGGGGGSGTVGNVTGGVSAFPILRNYGTGGNGSAVNGQQPVAGTPGVVIVEW